MVYNFFTEKATEKFLNNKCNNFIIFFKSKNNYFWKNFPTYILKFFLKTLSCTLNIKVRGSIFLMSRPWKVGLGTWHTLPDLTTKSKIIEGEPPSPQVDKKSPIGIGLLKISYVVSHLLIFQKLIHKMYSPND